MTHSRLLLFCWSLGLGAVASVTMIPEVAHAQDPNAAEKQRLEAEMKKLAARNAWDGVERNYLQLEELKVAITYDDYVIGSQAAGSLGKTFEKFTRLQAAKKLKSSDEIDGEIAGITSQYGSVDIKGNPRQPPVLTPDVMPFAPDQRKSVEYAQTVVNGTGGLHGMLPAGDYTVGTTKFTVTAGQPFTTVDVKKQKGGPVTHKTGLLVYSGPVLDLGYAYSTSAEPTATDVTLVEPHALGGSGAALHGGLELGFTKLFAVAPTLGYTGMYGNDTFHGIDGWLAIALRPGDLRIAVGPTYGALFGTGTGVTTWFDRHQDPKTYPTTAIPYSGYALAGGAELSVGYSFVDLEPLQAGLELSAAWQTDGTRQFMNAGLRVAIVPKVPRFKG